MNIENIIRDKIAEAIQNLYQHTIDSISVQVAKTKKEFEGDFTVVAFPFLKISKKTPEQTAGEIGEYLIGNIKEISRYNVIKGFLNIVVSNGYWLTFINEINAVTDYGYNKPGKNKKQIVVEYSSPNTNKPLHLGHIRNNLLGWSVAEILKANGKNVVKVNLVNDRGIHICKSMLAWQKWGNGATPQSTGTKGDKLVGDFYVKFDNEYKSEIGNLISKGFSEDDAKKNASLIIATQELLKKWEAGDDEVRDIWKMMNGWVYKGFDETYKKMGVDFDRTYYESDTYQLGKAIVLEGLKKGILQKKDDGSAWIDLTQDGLDEKLLLRADGTSVYMTQDIGTAVQRFNEFNIDKHIYVVGNEQNYHFHALSLVLNKLGYNWSKDLYHLSYGMVELPEGRMKSREGAVVDADDLIDEMILTAREISKELGKLDGVTAEEAEKTYKMIALGALKYFILKVDPKKNMLFDPKESIDFNGNTGPFIQYTYARICSVLRKAKEQNIVVPSSIDTETILNGKEIEILKLIYEFPSVVKEAGKEYSPALIANFVYELTKEYNQFYHDFSILKEENPKIRDFRLILSKTASRVIKSAMGLLGIEVPEKM
ncbi:MAG: arginine--tRNA ligase [Bacteroidia bacterium]|nr:arginine--tRNA ligase [Bacteroidia bacterium]